MQMPFEMDLPKFYRASPEFNLVVFDSIVLPCDKSNAIK